MCVCVCMCVFLRTYPRRKATHICVYIYICIYMCVYIYVCVCVFERYNTMYMLITTTTLNGLSFPCISKAILPTYIRRMQVAA